MSERGHGDLVPRDAQGLAPRASSLARRVLGDLAAPKRRVLVLHPPGVSSRWVCDAVESLPGVELVEEGAGAAGRPPGRLPRPV